MRLAIVTNIPAPYRVPVYGLVARTPGIDLTLIFLAGREPDRAWDLPASGFEAVYLNERFLTWRGRYIHYTPGVRAALRRIDPDVVITTGFNPAHIAAFIYARQEGKRHVPMTDGTPHSESQLIFVHRLARSFIYRRSAAFIGASDGSFELYRSYGVRDEAIFKSHLCCDLDAYARCEETEKRHDMIFAGRFVTSKSPAFVLDLGRRVSELIGRPVRLLFAGSGPLEAQLRAQAEHLKPAVLAEFFGHARQDELPALYRSARLCVFPTTGEPWGVVANEACAAGLPVLTTPGAGAAGEIVRHGENGYVLPLELETWARHVATLLQDEELRERMGRRGSELVQPYSFANAAQGIIAAARYAMAQAPNPQPRQMSA